MSPRKLPKYIKLDNITIHRGVHVFLPEEILVRANYVMRRQGYNQLRPWVINIIAAVVNEYFRQHPEELKTVEELEKKFRGEVAKYGVQL